VRRTQRQWPAWTRWAPRQLRLAASPWRQSYLMFRDLRPRRPLKDPQGHPPTSHSRSTRSSPLRRWPRRRAAAPLHPPTDPCRPDARRHLQAIRHL